MLALGLLTALPTAVRADELLVGALRDQDGAIVAGASVRAYDASGHEVARDTSAADGTFALTAVTRPASVAVDAAGTAPVRVTVPPAGSLAVTLYRYRAGDLVPSAADVAALPAGSLRAVASLVPYRVAGTASISDRWLSGGRGVITIEGLPFYRRGDGADATALLPAHALGVLDVESPLQAAWYGDRAGGGVIDARLFDRFDRARLASSDAALMTGGRDAAFAAAESFEPDGVRRIAAASLGARAGPIDVSAVVLAGSTPQTHYAGAGADVRAATRTLDLRAHIGVTSDDSTASGVADDGSVAGIDLDASGRGANATAVRLRWRDERGAVGTVYDEHRDAALVLGTTRGSTLRATANVALAYGDDATYDVRPSSALAILPSLALDAPLGGGMSVHAAMRSATLGTPGVALARSTMTEIALGYDDRRRVHAEVLAFAESDAAPPALDRGLAASFGWEVARRVSVRAWSLRDTDDVDVASPLYPGGPTVTSRAVRPFDRDVVWFTWDAPVRVDLVLRSGLVEGGVRVPLGRRTVLAVGSFVRGDGSRATTVGVAAR